MHGYYKRWRPAWEPGYHGLEVYVVRHSTITCLVYQNSIHRSPINCRTVSRRCKGPGSVVATLCCQLNIISYGNYWHCNHWFKEPERYRQKIPFEQFPLQWVGKCWSGSKWARVGTRKGRKQIWAQNAWKPQEHCSLYYAVYSYLWSTTYMHDGQFLKPGCSVTV